MEHVLVSHVEQTVERLALALQNTMMLNDDGLSGTSDVDDLGVGGRGISGLLAHVGVAVNALARVLVMFVADVDFRQAQGKDSVRRTDGLDRARSLHAPARTPGW